LLISLVVSFIAFKTTATAQRPVALPASSNTNNIAVSNKISLSDVSLAPLETNLNGVAPPVKEHFSPENKNWPLDALLVVLNACLIYTSAFGIQNNVISQTTAMMAAPMSLNFRSSW